MLTIPLPVSIALSVPVALAVAVVAVVSIAVVAVVLSLAPVAVTLSLGTSALGSRPLLARNSRRRTRTTVWLRVIVVVDPFRAAVQHRGRDAAAAAATPRSRCRRCAISSCRRDALW